MDIHPEHLLLDLVHSVEQHPHLCLPTNQTVLQCKDCHAPISEAPIDHRIYAVQKESLSCL